MGKRTPNGQFSNDFWKDSKSLSNSSVRPNQPSPKQALSAKAYLYPIDESEEFYDPFSDLNLFLTKKIKKEMLNAKKPKQWSSNIQNTLLERILPEFRQKFPKYHLGSAALKKSWDKVRYYYDKVGKQKEILTAEGKLDIYRMIRHSLVPEILDEQLAGVHPYNFSHQLAVKISECVATLDGIRPKIDHLTKLIWAVEKHLIPRESIPETIPIEDFDKIDKLIVRSLLTQTFESPLLSQKALSHKIKDSLQDYLQLSTFKNIEEATPYFSIALSKELFPHTTLHKFDEETKAAITTFIQGQLKRCRKIHGRTMKLNLTSIVRRILSLYPLAAGLPKKLADNQLDAAMKYIYSLSTNVFSPVSPSINQSIFTFINSEIIALKDRKDTSALENVIGTLLGAFKEGASLPKLNDSEMQELEVWVWQVIEQEEKLLAKKSSELRALLKQEISHILIDQKEFHFEKAILATIHFFKQIRDFPIFKNFFEENAAGWQIVEPKIERWAVQNDMVSASLHFDAAHPLTRLCHREGQVSDYLKDHPFLRGLTRELNLHMSIIRKTIWYREHRAKGETNFSRFLKWHQKFHSNQDLGHLALSLLPLTPMPKEEVESKKYAGNAE
ncbi:MAG: hypothetical protein MRY21_07120 [Simkaniaceae bacterium]|nr:hypothetical protein [Simkaniaceae bacterium]